MLLHHDDVGAQDHLKAPATSDAVHGRNYRLVKIPGIIQSAETADAPVFIGLLAGRRRFQIPSRREESIAGAGDDGDAQSRVVAKGGEHLIQSTAGRQIDRIRLGTIDRDFKNGAIGGSADSVGHGALPVNSVSSSASWYQLRPRLGPPGAR